MVTVNVRTTDPITAWRIRDLLACHPLLAGASVDIQVEADYDEVVLQGWVRDERLMHMAGRLARSSAGRRSVHVALERRMVCRKVSAHRVEAATATR